MILVTRRRWHVSNGVDHATATIPPGRHEVERIPNPYGHASPWIVLKGTTIGACEGFWRDWNHKPSDDFTVELLEDEAAPHDDQ